MIIRLLQCLAQSHHSRYVYMYYWHGHCTILPSEQKALWELLYVRLLLPGSSIFSDVSMSPSVPSFRSLFRQHFKRNPLIFLKENNYLSLSSLSCFIFLHGTDCWLRLDHVLSLLSFLSHSCFIIYRQGLYLFISVHAQQKSCLIRGMGSINIRSINEWIEDILLFDDECNEHLRKTKISL